HTGTKPPPSLVKSTRLLSSISWKVIECFHAGMNPKNIRRVFSVEPSRHSGGNRCDSENPRNPRVTNNKVSLFLTRAQTLSAEELKVVDTFTRNSRSLSVSVHNAWLICAALRRQMEPFVMPLLP